MRTIISFRSGPASPFAPELNGELIDLKYGNEAARDAFVVETSTGLQLFDAASGMMLNQDLMSWARMNGLNSFETSNLETLANSYMYKRTGEWKIGSKLIDSLNSCPVLNSKPYKIVKTIKVEAIVDSYRYDDDVDFVGSNIEHDAIHDEGNLRPEIAHQAEQSARQLDFFGQLGM